MAAMNSSVLACNYAISGTELNTKANSVPYFTTPVMGNAQKLPVIKAQQVKESRAIEGRRASLAFLAATIFTSAAAAASISSANAGVIEEYLEKSKANKVA